jgi:hypothetical protein
MLVVKKIIKIRTQEHLDLASDDIGTNTLTNESRDKDGRLITSRQQLFHEFVWCQDHEGGGFW